MSDENSKRQVSRDGNFLKPSSQGGLLNLSLEAK